MKKISIGDCFEIAGKEKIKIIYVDDEKFIAGHLSLTGVGVVVTGVSLHRKDELDGKYWIKEIEKIECSYAFEKL